MNEAQASRPRRVSRLTLRWSLGPRQEFATARRKNQTLVLALIEDERGCSVLALEVDNDSTDDVRAFFASHAHALVCERLTLARARAAATRYARAWRKGEALPKCECSEIESPPARRHRGQRR